MRYDYIDPFVSTTLQVLRRMIPGDISRGEVTVLRGDRIWGEVMVVIRVTGESEGDVIIGMNTATALGISSVLTRATFDALTQNALDPIAELCNMIAGNAVSALNDLGFDFSVNPPNVTVRAGAASEYKDREALQIPLILECGEMTMNVLLGTD